MSPHTRPDGRAKPQQHSQTSSVYADEKGESHFSEMEIAMSESQLLPGLTAQKSTPAAATSIQFLTVSGWTSTDWYPAPARQFVISLDRTIEIETSDGQRRQV